MEGAVLKPTLTASPTPSEAASGPYGWLRARVVTVLVVALGGFVGTLGVRAAGLDEVVPDSAVFFLSVRDVPELRQRLTRLPLYQLYQEESVQAFLGEPIKRAQEALREVEGETEGIMSQFVDCCTGEVAMILLLSEPTFDVEPNALVIAAISGKHEQAQVVLERTVGDLLAQGYEERRHEFAGATIIELTKTVTTESSTEMESDYHCLTDGYLLMGDSLEGMKEALVGLLREPSGALAAQPDYQACRRALGRDADLFAYTNSAALLAVLAADAESDEEDAEAMRAFRALGLDQVRAVGLAVGVRDQDLWVSAYLFPAGEEGLFGMFPGVRGGHQRPHWVPGDALSYLWLDLDFDRGWQWLNALIRTMSPPDYMTFRNSLVVPGPSGEPILDVERDLIETLGQGVSLYLRRRVGPSAGGLVSGGEGLPGRGAGSALDLWELAQATGLKDGPALSATVERLRVQGFGPFALLQPVDFQGQRLYTISSFFPMPFVQPPPGEAQPPPEGQAGGELLALSILTGLPGGDKLIIAPRLQTLQDVVLRLAGPSAGVGPPGRFERAMARIPTGSSTFLVVYTDLQGHLRAVGEYVRRHGALPVWVSFGPLALLNLFDLQPDLFPPDEVVLPYLDASVIFGTNPPAGGGLLLHFHLLAPPQWTPHLD